jgi:signal transduction histidine kinase
MAGLPPQTALVYLSGIATPAELPLAPDILRAINRSAAYGQVSRWLLHDLRNPCQALTLITELMQGEPDPADDPPENTIREATRHLVQSLETLDRILRAPSRDTQPGPVSLREQLEFLGTLHQIHRSTVALDLSAALSPSLPAVSAVEDHLEHALINLLLNALEACADRQHGRISVSAAAGTDSVVLEMVDNGRGVAAEVRDRLFQPFVTTRTDRPFAGLGLAVARELLGRAGGTLDCDRGLREGARFIVTLPAWT